MLGIGARDESGVMRGAKASKDTQSGIDIQHVADLSMLKIPAGEQESIRKDLLEVVAFADQLAKIDTEGVEPMAHIGGLQNVWREDAGPPVRQSGSAAGEHTGQAGRIYLCTPGGGVRRDEPMKITEMTLRQLTEALADGSYQRRDAAGAYLYAVRTKEPDVGAYITVTEEAALHRRRAGGQKRAGGRRSPAPAGGHSLRH